MMTINLRTIFFKNLDLTIYVLLASLSLAVSLMTQWDALSSPLIIADDVMQHTYWMERFHDRDLFPNDLYVLLSAYLSPWGFKLIYYFATFFAGPIAVGKALSVILYALSGVFLYNLGKEIQGRSTGIFLSLLFIIFPVHVSAFTGGLQRAFAYPLLILFLIRLHRLDLAGCSLILLLQILFYPAYFLACYLCMIFVVLPAAFVQKKIAFDKVSFFTTILPLAAYGIFVLVKHLTRPAELGDVTSARMLRDISAFFVGRRSPSLPPESIPNVLWALFRPADPFFIFSFPFFALRIVHEIYKKRYASLFACGILVSLLSSSLILYGLASVFLLKLGLPAKYADYTLSLIRVIVMASGLGFIFDTVSHTARKGVLIAVFAACGFYFYGSALGPGGYHPVDQRANAGLYGFLSGLPKNAVIAANPALSDYISCFSKRKVFVKYELAYPWFDRYARTVQGRVADLHRAYFSQAPAEVYRFCRENGISFFVVDKKDFRDSQQKAFLPNIEKHKILFRSDDGDLFVIDTSVQTLLY